jgi:flagellar hook-associated protein 1
MSLSAAFNIINSSFAATAAQTALISSNITNANTAGYTLKTANLATNGYGGVEISSISSAANSALLDQVNLATSEAAAQQALSTGLSTLAQTVSDSSTSSTTSGATENGASPSAMISNLESALETYEASPSNQSLGDSVVQAASNLASSLNQASTTIDQVREQADSGIASAVNQINSLLTQFGQANSEIVTGLQTGQDVTNDEDTRNSILTQLSQEVGVTTTTGSNGSMSIFTDSGVTLFQNTARTVSFTPTATFTAGVVGNAVTVDGVPITGPSAPMAVQSGAIAGLANLRDTVAPEYQAQLDQIAGGLISAFSETDQSTSSTGPALPGLFTFTGATGVPSTTSMTGLAGEIEVNPTVNPSDGGNVLLLRDGGISGNSAYTYNTTGDASFSGRIEQLVSALSAPTSFDSSAGLGASGTLSSYASDSVSWLQGQNQQASNEADFQSSVVTQATSALSNATGVNMDTEMTNMLNLENSYTTTAKLFTTANDMFTALLDSIPDAS